MCIEILNSKTSRTSSKNINCPTLILNGNTKIIYEKIRIYLNKCNYEKIVYHVDYDEIFIKDKDFDTTICLMQDGAKCKLNIIVYNSESPFKTKKYLETIYNKIKTAI